jgi:hypothetical protein
MTTRKSWPSIDLFFPPWWQSALQTWQIALTTPQVIAHRTARMAGAGPVYNARDRREFTRLGQEKVEAFSESLSAMAMQMYKINQDIALVAARQWWSWWTPMVLFSPLSTAQTAKAQSALMRSITSAATDKRLSRVVQKGLAPVHRRVTANAKRLGRVK